MCLPNHHSHVDTGLMLRAVPRPWRHELVVAAAADYFSDSHWKSGAVGENTRRFNARIETAVAALGDEALTDYWTARRRWPDLG